MTKAILTSSQAPMTITRAMVLFGAALLALFLAVAVTVRFSEFSSALAIIYFGLGISLKRVVLRQLIEWHPVCSTLRNIAGAKLGMALFWPVRYPGLFFQLLVSKHL